MKVQREREREREREQSYIQTWRGCFHADRKGSKCGRVGDGDGTVSLCPGRGVGGIDGRELKVGS